MRRAIDIREGEQVDGAAFQALLRAAIERHAAGKATRPKTTARKTAAR